MNRPLEIDGGYWPVAQTHVPFTVYIPLADEDIEIAEDGSIDALKSIQEHAIDLAERFELFVVLSGKIPELGTDFVESHTYAVPEDVDRNRFYGVAVDYHRMDRSLSWAGWDTFDSSQ